MGVKNRWYGQRGEPPILAKVLTIDHKPEDPLEQERVKNLGWYQLKQVLSAIDKIY